MSMNSKTWFECDNCGTEGEVQMQEVGFGVAPFPPDTWKTYNHPTKWGVREHYCSELCFQAIEKELK